MTAGSRHDTSRAGEPGAERGARPPGRQGEGPALYAGFSTLTVDRSVRRGGVRAAIWYPTTARESTALEGVRLLHVARDAVPAAGAFPLVAVSHGSGGSLADHHGAAEALARTGHVVLCVTHPGDNEHDLSGVLGPEQLLGRCRHLSRALDHVLGTHKYGAIVDDRRVAAVGCGVGAYTLLVLAGARPDFNRFAARRDAAELLPHWEALVRRVPEDVEIPRDERIGAAVLLDPDYGYLFDDAELAKVTIPALVYARTRVSEPWEWEVPLAALPGEVERHSVSTDAEQPFAAGCAPAFAEDYPELAAGSRGLDRSAFQARLGQVIGAFAARVLSPG